MSKSKETDCHLDPIVSFLTTNRITEKLVLVSDTTFRRCVVKWSE